MQSMSSSNSGATPSGALPIPTPQSMQQSDAKIDWEEKNKQEYCWLYQYAIDAIKTANAIGGKEEKLNWKLVYDICKNKEWDIPQIFASFCSATLLKRITAIYKQLESNPQQALPYIYYLDENYAKDLKRICGWLTLPQCHIRSVHLQMTTDHLNNAKIIAKTLQHPNCKLTKIGLSENYMGDSAIKVIFAAIQHPNCSLTTIFLDSNHIQTDGLIAIANTIQHPNCKLTEISLRLNKMRDEGTTAITTALKHPNCKITKISFAGCDIGNRGAIMIASTLQDPNCKLTEIDLRGNDISGAGIILIAKALKHPNCNLTKIDLGFISNKSYSLEVLAETLVNPGCKLRSLGLTNCIDFNSYAKIFATALRNRNCKLESIDLSGCRIWDTGVLTLVDALQNPNCNIISINLGESDLREIGGGTKISKTALAKAIINRKKAGRPLEVKGVYDLDEFVAAAEKEEQAELKNEVKTKTDLELKAKQEKLEKELKHKTDEEKTKQELEAKAKALASAQASSDQKVPPQVATVSAAPQHSATLQQVSDGKASDIKTQPLASASSSQAIMVSIQAPVITPTPQSVSLDSKQPLSKIEAKADSKQLLAETKTESKTSASTEQSAEEASFFGSVWDTLGDFWTFITCRRKKPPTPVPMEMFTQLEQDSKAAKTEFTRSIEAITGSIKQQDERLLQGFRECKTELAHVDVKALEARAIAETKVSGQQIEFNDVVTREQERIYAQHERKFICQNDKLGDFYFTFYHLLWENWLAYSAIHSRRIVLSDDSPIMTVINGIGQQIPGVGMVTSLLDKLVKAERFPGQKTAINRVAAFFDPDNETGAMVIEALARKLTLAQREIIAKLTTQKQGFFKGVGQSLVRLKDKLTINDIDNLIKKMAEAQVEQLLSAIITARLRPHPTLADVKALFTAVLPDTTFPRIVPEIAEASDARALSSSNATPSTFSAVSSHTADSVIATDSLSTNHSVSGVEANSSTALLASLAEENRTLRTSMAEQETKFAKWKQERELTFAEMLRKLDEESKKTHAAVEQVQARVTTVAITAEEAKKRAEAAAHLAEDVHVSVVTAVQQTEKVKEKAETALKTATDTKDTVVATTRRIEETVRQASNAQAEAITAIKTAKNAHEQAEQARIEAANAKTKAEATQRALERSGVAPDNATLVSGNSETQGAHAQLLASATLDPSRHDLDPQLVALVDQHVRRVIAPIATHIAERLEDQAQQQTLRKRKM